MIKKLKNIFEKFNSKYKSKREFFEKKIEKWKTRGDDKIYQKAIAFLQEADACSKGLEENFMQVPENQLDKIVIKKKLKDFKKAYNSLNELTKPIWRQWIEAIVVAGVLVFVLRTFVFGLYHVPTGSAEHTILVGDRIWGNKFIYYFDKINRGDCIIFDNPEFIYDTSNSINYFWQKYIGFPIPLLGLDSGPENWTKRITGIPGDTIEGRIEDERTVVYLNGKKIDETSYVNSYPLIKLKKTAGFLDMQSFGPFGIPTFLRKISKFVDYTYDPKKSFADQPFYNMTKEEVVKGRDGNFILREPYSPTYEFTNFYGGSKRSIDSFGPIRIPNGKYWVMGDSRKNSRDSRYWGFLDENLIHGRASFVIYSIDSEEPFWLFELLNHPIDFWTKSVRWNRFFKWIK